MDGGKETEIDQDREQGDDENIEHRPPADEGDESKEHGFFPVDVIAVGLHGEQQDAEADNLENRYEVPRPSG